MNWRERIAVDNEVLAGKPVVCGTRLAVEFLLGLMAQGWNEQQILENYPQLRRENLQAVFAFSADCLHNEPFFGQALAA
ncbi:MAG: DUF433 domain-containing protein [Betaproteobacteria bacterium]|nr:DUF433 domain-containing protein [Betaproteobacteria bacterium]